MVKKLLSVLWLSCSLSCPALADTNWPLFEAIEQGNKDRVKVLLKRGRWGVNARNVIGMTPLGVAVDRSNVDIVELLLQAGADSGMYIYPTSTVFDAALGKEPLEMYSLMIDYGVRLEDHEAYDDVPLLDAIYYGQSEFAKVLIDKGAWVMARREDGDTPLLAAVRHQMPEIVNLLLARGALPYDIQEEEALLTTAVGNGNLHMLDKLLNLCPRALNRPESAERVVQAALIAGNTDVLTRLADRGLNTVIIPKVNGEMLMNAAEAGNEGRFFRLLQWGADWKYIEKDGQTMLMAALSGGNLAIVKELLARGADVHHRDEAGQTLLRRYLRHPELWPLLIEKGADPAFLDKDGQNLLWHLELSKHWEIAEWLMKWGLDINATNAQGETLLMREASRGRLESVKLLLGHGARLEQQDPTGKTALMFALAGLEYASGPDQSDAAKWLIAQGADLQHQDKDGRSMLYYATKGKSGQLLEMLVAKGLRFQASDDVDYLIERLIQEIDWWPHGELLVYLGELAGYGPEQRLQLAIQAGQYEKTRALLEDVPHLDSCDIAGQTCLMLAVKHPEILKLLLVRSQAIDVRDKDGKTALMLAAANGKTESVAHLLKAGARLEIADKAGANALLYAALSGWPETFRTLLNAGAEINANGCLTDTDDELPWSLADVDISLLHWAVYGGNIEIVEMLLNRGLKPDIRNENGATPLMLAAALGDSEMIRYLVSQGANPSLRDDEDMSVLEYAEEGTHKGAEQLGLHEDAMELLEKMLAEGVRSWQ